MVGLLPSYASHHGEFVSDLRLPRQHLAELHAGHIGFDWSELSTCLRRRVRFHGIERESNGCQRIAQLVRQRRQEFVLVLIRFDQRLADAILGVEILVLPPDILLEVLPIGDVSDRAGDEHPLLGLERTQADLDRKLGAVLAPSVQFEARAHRPCVRIAGVALAVSDMDISKPIRDEDLD